MYVVALPSRNPGFSADMAVIPQSLVDDLENEGREILKKAKELLTGIQVRMITRTGHPAGEILEEAKDGYDLIVIGSRGLGEIRGFVMGSVSDRVTHHARCTVMVVH